MLKLPTYSSQGSGGAVFGGRQASAADFSSSSSGVGIDAGHRIQSAATVAMNDIQEQEARTALVKSTEVRAEYARKLDEAALSGGDLPALKQQMADSMSKIGDTFQTRKGQENLQLYAANSEIMFDQQANSIAVQRAKQDAKQQGTAFMVSASKLIQSNPLYLPQAEADADALAATFTRVPAPVRAEIAAGLRKDLNMAAAVSAARMDPAGTKKRLDAGEWDLTPAQREVALNKADTEIRAARAEESYIRAEQQRQKVEADATARDEGFASIINGTFSRRQIMDDARLQPATREHLILLAEARAKAGANEERRSDPQTKLALWLGINAPEGSKNKIYNGDPVFNAVQSGKLNVTDANTANAQLAAQKDVNGRSFQSRLSTRIQTIGRTLNDSPQYKNQPELSASIQNYIISAAERKSAELRKANTPPDGMFDENSKDYFFKPGILKEAAAHVEQQALEARKAASTPVRSIEEALAVADGKLFIDSSGAPKQMTPALRAQLVKQAGAPRQTSSGKITGLQ